MAGANREPSSFVQSTMMSGRSVSTLFSCTVRMTSRAPMTPRIPSNRPPLGWESTWEPLMTGQSCRSFPAVGRRCCPSRRWSREVDLLQPFHEQVAGAPVLVRQGEALHASAGVAPIFAISSRLARSRAPLTLSFDVSMCIPP